jgi:circadian clock protein KaiC
MEKKPAIKAKVEGQDVTRPDVRPTGILELDQMLRGGLPTNAAVLLAGPPGAGKTILALQWLYAGYRDAKESSIYFTLTEPTTKLLKNLGKLSFHDPEFTASADAHVADFNDELSRRPGVHFIDLRIVMEDLEIKENNFTAKDIRKLCEAIVDMVGQSNARRVVIDSITALAYRLQTDDMVRTLIFDLGTYLGAMDANVIMTAEAAETDRTTAGVEEFIADGVIRMSYGRNQQDLVRTLEIVKMRGTDFDSRKTGFRINQDGIRLFPRLRQELQYQASLKRVTSGVPGLDEMLGGGYFEGSSILLSGSSGSGKTLIAVRAILGTLIAGEKAMFVTFEESRDHLIKSVLPFGWDLEKYEKEGKFLVLASYPDERSFDEHLSVIQHAVEDFGPALMVVDSITALKNVDSEEEVQNFTSRLIAYAKSKKVTCLLTAATANLTGTTETISGAHLSTITDTIVLLRFIEIQSELRRALLILKVRGSDHDKGLREYVITPTGIEVLAKFSGYEGLLAGSTRKVSQSTEEQLHGVFLDALGPMGEKIFLEQKRKGINSENVQSLVRELVDQGILSVRRKDEFLEQSARIFGTPPSSGS